DLRDDRGREEPGLLLGELQRGQQRRPPPGVARDFGQDLLLGRCRERMPRLPPVALLVGGRTVGRRGHGLGIRRHRSTSPMIGSVLAMVAIRSATSPPSAITDSAWMFAN